MIQFVYLRDCYFLLSSQFKAASIISLALLVVTASARPRELIIGGSYASPTRYPYFALLEIEIVNSPDSSGICGGTLIHEDIVLTAAHCIKDVASLDKVNSYISFEFTNVDGTWGYAEAQIKTIVPHPNYNKNNEANDIMIIKLDRSINQVKPIALNTERSVPAVGAFATVFGFGDSEDVDSDPFAMREIQVKSVSDDRCYMLWGETFMKDKMLCAYDDGKDVGLGDSGGPLILAGTSPSGAADVQVGVVSFGGVDLLDKNSPTVYTRVSNYKTWIAAQICSLSSKKPTSCSAPKFCFSGETTVQVKNKGTLPMKALEIGDEVLAAAAGKYEKVYSFGHRHESVTATFLQFLPSTLEISRDHMVLVQGKYVPASAVQVGDHLESGSGDVIMVEAIHTVTRSGVYAPFTSSGSIVVSNIKASNYIAFQDSDRLIVGGYETPFTYQWIAHMSQSPHRILSQLGLTGAEEYTVDGMSTWIAGPHELSQWLMDQNGVIVAVMLVPAFGLGMLSMAVEGLVSIFV